jgi:hypothetical protein
MDELEQLGEQIAEQAAHLDAAMHRLLADLREFDRRGGWYTQGARSCAHWLAWRVGWDLVTAREHVRVAAKLAEFPAIDDALRRGEVSYSKVRAMLRVATPANADLLLDHARLMTASQLEALCRKYALVQRHGQDPHPGGDQQRRYVRRRDTDDGMVKIEAVLHPEEAELVWTMLNHAAAQLAREPDRAADSDSPVAREGAQVSGAVTAPKASGTSAARLLPGTTARRLDDSAESPELLPALEAGVSTSPTCIDPQPVDGPAASHQAGLDVRLIPVAAASQAPSACTPAAPANVEACPLDDSAEARDVRLVTLTAASPTLSVSTTGAPAHVETCPLHDSAESLKVVLATAAAAPRGCAGTCPIDDSTESSRPELPRPSLLDRLLDEADAQRAAEAVRHGEFGTRSSNSRESPSESGSSSAPTTERKPGALHQRADAARRAFCRADALISVAQRYLRGDRPERSPIEITLTIPASSLHAGTADPVEVGQMGEAFVSSETARRLGCDAGIIDIVEDEHGAPLSVGRKRRTIAGALKRALRKRDATCTYPGCDNRIFLEGHHIKHWADGGETSLNNALLLCSSHHRYVHEYGYTIERGSDQRPRFRDPHGRAVAEVPARPAVTDLGWPRIRAMNAPLEIDADTIACGWDGRPADYGAIVGHLVAADGLA